MQFTGIVFLTIGIILFICFGISMFLACKKDKGQYFLAALVLFFVSVFFSILGICCILNTPAIREKELRQNIIEANNAYQKFLIDHPEFKELKE